MSSLTFNAFIGPVHFDPKNRAMKITLIAASNVSMDKLTSLGPADESVKITLESAQTKIIQAISPEASAATEEIAQKWLEVEKKTADELRDDEMGGEEEEQLDQADEDEEEDDEEGLGDGLI